MPLPEWARAHGPPLYQARIRGSVEEFDVTEELGFEFTGDGEHDLLFVEKTNANTEWVARQLAKLADVPLRDVGYAGLKDRRAVTRQWFSVPRWHSPDWSRLATDGLRVIDLQRHQKKLRRGAHRGNRFRIVVRGERPAAEALEQRLGTIASRGVPNYFGKQRFGRDGQNLALANDWSRGKRLSRQQRSFAISTVRSFLFNGYLDARVRAGSWDQLVPGDLANLDGSRSVFPVDAVDDELARRCEQMDLHPAGPLVGAGSPAELAAVAHPGWLKALTDARVEPASRSLRLRVSDFRWSIAEESLVLEFALTRGAFATSVLREIADVSDSGRSD